MSISAFPSIQMAHTAILVTRIKGGGKLPEDPKDPKDKLSPWQRFVKWWKKD